MDDRGRKKNHWDEITIEMRNYNGKFSYHENNTETDLQEVLVYKVKRRRRKKEEEEEGEGVGGR